MMYALRPIVTLADAHPRTETMYVMQNIHEKRAGRPEGVHDDAEIPRDAKMPDVVTEQVIHLLQSPLPDFNELEIRQMKILKQLVELKKQVSMLCDFLKQSNLEKKPQSDIYEEKIVKDFKLQKPVNISLVVNANLSKPPYSICALQKLWKDIDIRVESYVHSTIVGTVPAVFRNHVLPTSNNSVNLSLIYKKVKDLEIVAGLHNCFIVGEVNFLRYLSRLIDAHNYENNDVTSVQTTDNILDLCYRVHHQTSSNETNAMLHVLHDAVKQTQWTGKGEPSIADIAAWSTIKQFSLNREVPRFLHKWYERCEKTFIDKTITV